MMVLLLVLACGGAQPEVRPVSHPRATSTPAHVKAEFVPEDRGNSVPINPDDAEIIPQLFPAGAGVRVPRQIAPLVPGMPAAEALAALEGLREPRIPLQDSSRGDSKAVTAILADMPELQLGLVMQGGVLSSLDLLLPDPRPDRYFRKAWGPPGPDGLVWDAADGELRAVLRIDPDGGRALLSLRRR